VVATCFVFGVAAAFATCFVPGAFLAVVFGTAFFATVLFVAVCDAWWAVALPAPAAWAPSWAPSPE
jgi:hypothetical protein